MRCLWHRGLSNHCCWAIVLRPTYSWDSHFCISRNLFPSEAETKLISKICHDLSKSFLASRIFERHIGFFMIRKRWFLCILVFSTFSPIHSQTLWFRTRLWQLRSVGGALTYPQQVTLCWPHTDSLSFRAGLQEANEFKRLYPGSDIWKPLLCGCLPPKQLGLVSSRVVRAIAVTGTARAGKANAQALFQPPSSSGLPISKARHEAIFFFETGYQYEAGLFCHSQFSCLHLSSGMPGVH